MSAIAGRFVGVLQNNSKAIRNIALDSDSVTFLLSSVTSTELSSACQTEARLRRGPSIVQCQVVVRAAARRAGKATAYGETG